MKTVLFSIFILLNLLVFIVTEYNINQRINSSLYTHLNNLKIHYNVFMRSQKDSADVIYDMTIKDEKVINLISKAWAIKNELKRDQIRVEIIKELEDKYKLFKEKGVLQYHIVFPNNVTYVRMHKINKYGDDLTNIRLDFAKVNKEHIIVRGFAQGRTAHAIRNVYPIFDSKNIHIGAIEISFPTEELQKDLNEVSKIHSNLLVKKSVFTSKAWKRDDLILKYSPSIEHKDYLMTTIKMHQKNINENNIKSYIFKLKDKIEKNISKEKEFSLLLRNQNMVKIASFLPIKQNITKETVAWIVSYDDDNFIFVSLRDMMIIRVLSFLILAILAYFMYRIMKQRKILNNLIKSYDKNVIFSKLNTDIVYTHVSEALCKISGYTEQELIGKKSIIKEILLKDKFMDIQESFIHGNTWKGEIKDKKKCGSYYWVDLEIEPIWEANKIIGYNCIGQDITDRKDVENIQKEIIFTMGSIGESRSKETANHVKRVALYSEILARHYGLSKEDIDILGQASPMHDIGKVAIPDSILNKPGKLNENERITIEEHAIKGYNMLKYSNRKLLQAAAIIAYEHHERWDGSGYPRGLKEHDIHIYGRITALADVFDALGSKRCYKEVWSDDKIFDLLNKEKGKHFDPDLVNIFFKNIEEFLEVRQTFRDLD